MRTLYLIHLFLLASLNPLFASDDEGDLEAMSISSFVEEMDCASDNPTDDELPSADTAIFVTNKEWDNPTFTSRIQTLDPTKEQREQSAKAANEACNCIYRKEYTLAASYLTAAVQQPHHPNCAQKFFEFFKLQYQLLTDSTNPEGIAALAHQMGMCYEYGYGVQMSLETAYQYYLLSEENNFIYALAARERVQGKMYSN